jgi:hypothetical protein
MTTGFELHGVRTGELTALLVPAVVAWSGAVGDALLAPATLSHVS